MISTIVKRDGRCVLFDIDKIAQAIFKAAQVLGGKDYDMACSLAQQVVDYLENDLKITNPSVEQIQDAVEHVLIENGHARYGKGIYPLPLGAYKGPGNEYPADENL